MKITLVRPKKALPECDLLITAVFKQVKHKDKFEISQFIKNLDKQWGENLLAIITDEGFSAKESQSFVSSTLGQSTAKNIALLGLGNVSDQNIDLYRRCGGEAYKIAQKKRAKKVAFFLPENTTVPVFDVVQAFIEGFKLASYVFSRYITKDKSEIYCKELEIYLDHEFKSDQKHAVERACEITESVNLARDLINECPKELTPVHFAELAQQTAKNCGLKISILDEKQLKKERMNLMLAVASAASDCAPPRLIKISYAPKKPSKRIIALIGKGVTFDSGGLDLKPADGMLEMKVDMSGAAAVLGTMRALSKLKPSVNIVAYMACVENGIGSMAYHPGDIIVSRQGLTVEINNTDAEGRLILADAINYAQEHDKPDTIIDIATLTGACMVALGAKTAGIFTNDDALSHELINSGKNSGESFWRLPLLAELKDVLKSPIADIKNCGDRYGGSITAALFLQEFIDSKIKWAHLDIAGPATNNKAHAYNPSGGVGFAVRTLVDYIMSQK